MNEHFQLFLSYSIQRLVAALTRLLESKDAVLKQFGFLDAYSDRAQRVGKERIEAYEAQHANTHLPLRSLCQQARLDSDAIVCLITTGMVEEDARFGMLFETLQGVSGPGPNAGTLHALYGDDTRRHLRDLHAASLLQVSNPQAPRPHWIAQPPPAIWDAMRGDRVSRPADGVELREIATLPAIEDLVLPATIDNALPAVIQMVANGELSTVIVRGPRRNGRRTFLSSIAKKLGRSALLLDPPVAKGDDERWRLAGPLSALLGAMPITDTVASESLELPGWKAYAGPVGIACGASAGIHGPLADRSYTFGLPVPQQQLRGHIWRRALPGARDHTAYASTFRMTSGNIVRAAKLAATWAAVEGRTSPSIGDVRSASRTRNRQALDSLATRVETSGHWGHLSVPATTLRELQTLEGRCRNRERLSAIASQAVTSSPMNPGVRVLFTGPSGAGKTLAARILASVLEMDLYRVDLSSVVNKYIGETEKNLDRLFSRAEELDVILLLDEGDALMTQRTGVQNANDRYANLETNFLLQRIESYEGILIVTTNAGDRIDNAFQRRMDVSIDFRPSEAIERWTIWQAHLPPGHRVSESLIEETAIRCVLSGGQIRNAAIHASLLALNSGSAVSSEHMEEAVRREYRKSGAVCPLRSRAVQ